MNWKIPYDLQERQNPLKMHGVRPNPVDLSESYVVNDALAIGLYQGTYQGLKLASSLAYPIVAVPVTFMGLPTPKSDNPRVSEALAQIVNESAMTFQKLFLLRRMVGTGWVWPNWDSKMGRINHELIPNASIVDIIRDVDSGEVLQIISDEQITVQSGENKQSIVNRKRYFTKQSVRVEYTGDVPANLVNRQVRNPAGIMPIPFANDVIDNKLRGQSVFTRPLPHLKNYHDALLKWNETLVKFNAKQVQTIAGTVDQWFDQNPQAGGAGGIDVASLDLILNKKDESTEYIFPSNGMTDAFKSILETYYYNIVESSGVPEMAFGLSLTGNHATAEQNMTILANTVNDDRTQINGPVKEYFSACLRLMSGATMQNLDDTFTVSWNDLEVVSQEVRANIFQKFSDGVSKLTANASVPLETIHKLFLNTFPKATEADWDTWRATLDKAAQYKQYQSASLIDALDVVGEDLDKGAM